MSNGPEPETQVDTRSPLRRLFTSRSFMALFVSNALGFGGEQMRLAAQSWWILDEGGSKTEMGIAAGLRVIPVVIISLYAGVLIDRVGGKRVLILERLLLIFLAIITGLILLIDEVEIWHIVVLATIAGSTIALGTPATQTLVPAVVPKDLLQSANSINQLGFALGRTLGPLLAGILIAVRNAALALFGLATVYLAALIATFGITAKHQRTSSSGSATRQIADGLSYIRQTPVLMWTILMAFSVMFFGMHAPLIPVYARDVLDVGEVKFGWMWGAVAIGQATGALAIVARGGFQRKSRGVVAGAVVFGLGLIGFGLSENYWISLAFLFVTGLGFPLWVTSVVTLLQDHSKPEYLGRVMAVYAIALQGVSVGWMLGGVLMDSIGNFPTVLVAVGGGWVIVLVAMVASRDFRRA
ncbi:MAG: MFS transporter [Gammaproteobacteria bacterium]|nr:MFS transporter [Gammaproteobacteria bacterium]